MKRFVVLGKHYRPQSVLAGMVLCAGVFWAAAKLAAMPGVSATGLSGLTLAIVLGMIVGHTIYPRIGHAVGDGIAVSKQHCLRLGIVLFGLRLTFDDVLHVGWQGGVVDVVIVCSTLAMAWWLGHKKFGLDIQTTLLIGAGSAICGAAAILAIEPVVKAKSDKVAISVATVVVFGTIAMFAYPWWFGVLQQYGVSSQLFSHYAGATIHEVAQVVVVGKTLGEVAAGEAVIVKMIRVMLLIPVLFSLSWVWQKFERGSSHRGLQIPWFGLGFLLTIGINTVWYIPPEVKNALLQLDNLSLGIAMVALGMTTHWRAVRTAGWLPLLLASILFGWLVVGGGIVVLVVSRLFG